MYWMQSKGVPKGLAVSVIIVFIILAGFLIGAFVGSSVQDFGSELPRIQARLGKLNLEFLSWIKSKGIELTDDAAAGLFNPGILMGMAKTTVSSFTNLLTNAFLIMLTVIFILMEASGFPAKLNAALEDPENPSPVWTHF